MEYGDGALMVKMGEAFIVLCPDPTLSQGKKALADSLGFIKVGR